MPGKGSKTVYIVDDEHIIASTLAAILKHSGYSAVAFTNPLEVLKSAETDAPTILISDVMMPEMNGVELAIKVKALCPGCKVLLFSGQAATVDLLTSARERGHDFELLEKPVHPKDLLAAIHNLSTVGAPL